MQAQNTETYQVALTKPGRRATSFVYFATTSKLKAVEAAERHMAAMCMAGWLVLYATDEW